MFVRLPELKVEGKRLGRHINHDPQSLQYLVEPATVAKSVTWKRVIPVLDQGNLGSCTGNATTGVLGTEVNYDDLSASQQKQLNEEFAVKVYSLATQLDSYSGTYPPEDTGSDGLSAAKAAQQLGFTPGYLHITSIASAQAAIQNGPFMVGASWYSGMDSPDSNGLVHVNGTVRGGHEFECIGYSVENQLWEFVNSWGDSWGKSGHFFVSETDFERLLKQGGDATQLQPLSVPTPTPTPTPVVNSVTKVFTSDQSSSLDDWANSPHVWSKATHAAQAWKAAKAV